MCAHNRIIPLSLVLTSGGFVSIPAGQLIYILSN